MDVAILGCGPSGLLCAWAAEQAGHNVVIFSKPVKSDIPGSQHLHGPIPGLTSPYPEGTIQFVRMGTAQDYARKVYGDSMRSTGWEHYLQVYPSWNVLIAYEKLWEHFEDRIVPLELPDHERLREICLSGAVTISTVPAQLLCHRSEHQFQSQPYAIKRMPVPPDDAAHEIVVYNGLKHDHWYRWSILGGLCSIETTAWEYLDEPGWERGEKAVDNNCDCWPTIHRCGRWAEWRHGVTMFKAYEKAVRLLGSDRETSQI